jgi:hypothetical protein
VALDLKARVSLDGSGFSSGLNRLEGAVGSFAGRIGAAFSVGAIANFSKQIIDWGSEINDLSTRLGVSVTRVQELSFAAKQSGADINDIAQGLTKIQDAFETMKQGGTTGEKLLKAFQTLGVSIEELTTKKPAELLDSIGKNLESTGINSEKTAAMIDLFGKSGGKLIPVLTELNAKTKEFQGSGLGITKEDISTLDEAGDKLDKIWLRLKVIGSQSMIGLGKILNGDLFTEFFKDVRLEAGVSMGEWLLKQKQREYGKEDKPIPDNTFLPSTIPPYKYDDEEERTITEYNKARERVLSRMKPPGEGDSLISVGNFLGARGSLQSVTEREMIRQSSLQQQILDELRRMKGGSTGDISYSP